MWVISSTLDSISYNFPAHFLKSHKYQLHLIKIKFSNVFFPNEHRSGLNIFPPMLKILSTGPEDAGIGKYMEQVWTK